MMLSQLQELQAPWNMPRELEDTPEMVCVLKNLADNDYKVVELAEYLEHPKEGEEAPDYFGWVQHDVMEVSIYEACYAQDYNGTQRSAPRDSGKGSIT